MRHTVALLGAIFLWSCTPTLSTPYSVELIAVSDGSVADSPPVSTTCEVPLAVAGDGLDDRLAIQAACNIQHCAHLRTGQYDIDIPTFVSPARRVYAMITASSCEIYGDGQTLTSIVYRGSAGGQDWQGIRLTGTSPSLHDLATNDPAITTTDEQTHAVQILGPATNASVYRVAFNHPQRGEPGGDCIQVVCYPNTPCVGVSIHDNDFDACDRSGVAVHSGASGVRIVDNRFPNTGNTACDFEGSGDTNDVLIANNVFAMSPGPHGTQEIQLQLVTNARITGNTLSGRNIDVYQSDDIEIDHNTIDLSQLTGYAAVNVEKDSSRINVHHNTITREPAAGAGQVIRGVPHGSGTPDHLAIADNTLIQHTTGDVINTSGLTSLSVERNVISYDGAPNVSFALQANGSAGVYGVRTTDIAVNNNTVSGPLHAVVATSGSYAGAGTLTATGNNAPGTIGVYCANINTGLKILGPFTIAGNLWSTSICGALAVGGP